MSAGSRHPSAAITGRHRRPKALEAIRAISDQTRVLLLGSVLVNLANFMIAPLLALYMHFELHQPAVLIGVVLTGQIVTQRVLPVITGPVADRWGPRRLIALGILVRSLGYLGLVFATDAPSLTVSASLVGCGGAVITPSVKAMIVQAESSLRIEALTLRSLTINVGAVPGPLLGALLFAHFRAVLVGTVVAHLGFLVLLRLRVPARQRVHPGGRHLLGSIVLMFLDLRLLGLTAGSAGFWFLYTQFTFTFPLYGQDRFGVGPLIAVLFALNAVVVLTLQYRLVTGLVSRCGSWLTIAVGTSSLTVAFACLAVNGPVVSLLVFTVLFSIGEMLIVPTLDNLASEISSERTLAGYLGFVSLGWAAGAAAGNLLGGALYSQARLTGAYSLFWAVNAGVGLVTAIAFILLGQLSSRAERSRAGR